MNDTKFAYLRNGRKNITFAYKFDDKNGQIVYNAAECGRKDQFVKALGREIASQRLELNRTAHPNRTASYERIGSDRYFDIANFLRSQS